MSGKCVCIEPDMIELDTRLQSTLGQLEPELAAVAVIKLAKILGGWYPFTRGQIRRTFAEAKISDSFTDIDAYFDLLVKRGWVVVKGDGAVFEVADDFVRRCYAMHPTGKSHSYE